MKSKVFQRSHCRICNSTNLTKVLSFEKMPLTEDFVSQGDIGSEFLADNNVYFAKTVILFKLNMMLTSRNTIKSFISIP